MTPVTEAPETAAADKPAVLKIDDPSGLETCDDKCQQPALWRVVFSTGELAFCAHHSVKHGFVQREISHAAYANENNTKGNA